MCEQFKYYKAVSAAVDGDASEGEGLNLGFEVDTSSDKTIGEQFFDCVIENNQKFARVIEELLNKSNKSKLTLAQFPFLMVSQQNKYRDQVYQNWKDAETIEQLETATGEFSLTTGFRVSVKFEFEPIDRDQYQQINKDWDNYYQQYRETVLNMVDDDRRGK